MGICGLDKAFAWLGSALQTPLSKPTETRVITVKARCPKCGEEFDVEVQVKQDVSGSVNNFDAWGRSGGSILTQCPWTVKK